jgi:glycosyltransferase involved in cell wall biosynthesis
MNILFCTFRYLSLTGTETFTYTLLKALSGKGHKIYFYSPFMAGKILTKTKKLNIFISNNLADFQQEKIDVIHCHHSPTAILARFFFPHTPLVYLMHGPLVFLEQPPKILQANYYGAISQEISRQLLKQKIPEKKLFIFPNSIDTDRFTAMGSLPMWPKNLLVLSNYLNSQGKKTIKSVARKLNLEVQFIGKNRQIWPVEKYIHKADIVMSLGRGVIEAMACAKPVLIFSYDSDMYKTGDGLVTKDNIDRVAISNFSGRSSQIPFNEANLQTELEKYHPDMGVFNRQYVLDHFDIDKNLPILLDIYKMAAKEPVAEYDQETVRFTAQGFMEILNYQKLSERYQSLTSLFFRRFRSQVLSK